MYNRNTERARPAQCTYVMQPPTLRNHPSIQNKRFNDREMLAFFNDRIWSNIVLCLEFEAVETARKESAFSIVHIIYRYT